MCIRLALTAWVSLLVACAAQGPATSTGGGSAAPAVAEAAGTTDLDALVKHPWQWVSFASPVEAFDVDTPAKYTLTFTTDGIVEVVADCNTAIAAYGVVGEGAGALSLTVAPRTHATCPPASRGARFLALLGGAASYSFQDGRLHIDLMADGGTLVFAPVR
jgi:heat shock protein HslJ